MKKEYNPTFLKWAGGKGRLLKQLDNYLPPKFNNYFEPFLGGGSFLFNILKNNPRTKVIAADINKELVSTYNTVKNNPLILIKTLEKHKKNYSKSEKEYFYKIRENFPSKDLTDIELAARLIFLNKTCFNGMYRVNSKNQFNVPHGRYTNPKIFEKNRLNLASSLLKNCEIIHNDFEISTKNAKKGDFIYFDPPYDPLKKGKSFVGYAKELFNELDQMRLAELFKKLTEKGCFCLLSNNNTQLINKIYEGNGVFINHILASRSINSNPLNRGKIKEVVITNYPPLNLNRFASK